MPRLHTLRSTLMVGVAAGALLAASPEFAKAQTVAAPPGFYVEGEGQLVFDPSKIEAGALADPTLPAVDVDGGTGGGGAITFGYKMESGWNTALRFRHTRTSSGNGPYIGVYTWLAGIPAYGGFYFPVFNAKVDVKTDYSSLDFEIGKDYGIGSGRVQIFGGLTYREINRDVDVSGNYYGYPITVSFNNDFSGFGPQIGARGDVPVAPGVGLIGSMSVAALFGESKFASALSTPGYGAYPFSVRKRHTVVALDGEAGVSFSISTGALILGYRANALFGALDTDQRVPPYFVGLGFPPIGDQNANFIQHGPFARFQLPLGGADN